jgi:hypothetical protein
MRWLLLCLVLATACDGGTSDGVEADAGVPATGFGVFTLRTSGGPCAPGNDCVGFVELRADGTLRLDVLGEPGVREAHVGDADLAAAMHDLTAPDLVALLDGAEPLCDPVFDFDEHMSLVLDGDTHEATTTMCPQAPLRTVRDVSSHLAETYLPD